ncbi:AfsR/SARP family transcriptional regulator [Streptomyces sp. CNQ085]|uniref:AfsR/SARP family transcriptional regulator n=1 Tax=Streptomyces sp. CNQ085 TaxID=2886944 RepID=UPI001F508CFB|nr:AfsR/SARP family transcriptional regulator [Streptomyces sp. CNQ085]MCI0384117.1 AfsR/SARP family transcriptional regulator [Streptomyces sp. CNQ085]
MPGHRQRGILATLALQPGRIVATDHLIEAVWYDKPPRTAMGQVQTGIWMLRTALVNAGGPAEAVQSCATGYRLNSELCSVDVTSYRTKIADARAMQRRGRLDEAVRLVRSAHELWRGPALVDITHRGLRGWAARLEEEHAVALQYRASLELQLGRHEEVIPDLLELVDHYPMRESLHADLMLALYRSGRQADALKVFHDVRQALAEELGIDPGPGLRTLAQAILRQDSRLAPRPATNQPPPHTALSAPRS